MGVTLSILTPCLNGERYLTECLDSIRVQAEVDFEHIVADGGSSDATLRLLDSHPQITVLSAPDGGIYDALNRALRIAHGDIIGVLNCDDRYAPHLLKAVAEAFRDPELMAVAGDAICFRDVAGGVPVVEHGFSDAGTDPLYMATLGTPLINAWFFRAAVFKQLGPFDASFKIAGDREFLLRFGLSGLPYRRLPLIACCYRNHPGSITFSGNERIWKAVLEEHHRITSAYLRAGCSRGRARELLRRARSRDTLQGAVYSARHGRMREFLRHALAGTRHDAVWPVRFLARAARGLPATLGLQSFGTLR